MAIYGKHVALTPEEVEQLLAHVVVDTTPVYHDEEDDYDNYVCHLVPEFVQERIREGQFQFIAETNRSIDALHRCLTNGTMTASSEYYPFNKVVAGKQLYHWGYIVFFVTRQEVADVAKALSTIDPLELRQRYATLAETDYQNDMEEGEDEWMVEYFLRLREFYRHTAEAQRPAAFYLRM